MSLTSNSTETPLSSGDTFTGAWELVKSFVAVSVSCKADTAITVSVEHSANGSDADHTDVYTASAGKALFKQVVLKAKYCRVKVWNNGDNQTYLRLYSKLLSNSQPDEMNVRLDAENDSILVKGLYNGSTKTLALDADGNLNMSLDTSALATETTLAGASTKLDDVVSNLGTLNTNVLNLMTDTTGQSILSSVGYHSLEATQVDIFNHNQVVALDVSGKLNDIKNLATSIKSNTAVPSTYTYVNFSLTTTPVQVGSGSVKLHQLMFDNETNNVKYFKVYDSATQPTSSDTPVMVYACNHSDGTHELSLRQPKVCNSGCWIVCTPNRGLNDAFGSLTSGEQSVQVHYST